MCAVLVVVVDVFREQPFEMALIHRDDMIQQVSSTTFDPMLRHAVLPGTLEGCPHLAHFQGPNYDRNLRPVFRIPVEDEKYGCRVEWKCFPQLLGDPLACRVLRDVEVEDPPAIMADHEKTIEHAEVNRGDCEESHRCDGFPVISKKGKPTFGRFGIPWSSFHPA